jgi:hypothetical protein
MNPMSSVEVAEAEKTVALRKRVTVTFEEFEPTKLEPPPNPKKDVGWFRYLLARLLFACGVESIHRLF